MDGSGLFYKLLSQLFPFKAYRNVIMHLLRSVVIKRVPVKCCFNF